MTTQFAWEFDQCAVELRDAAFEIAQDDPDFGQTWEAFCRAMWSNDETMEKWGMDRDEFENALAWAFGQLRKAEGQS